ncbi:MAG: tRNA-uridine aminocarboxypropyltransferase [Acidobacteriota bacterium]|nr:tRNA-uridine aminocarboxypropyltransferase [Acidobacteriota bacterium]
MSRYRRYCHVCRRPHSTCLCSYIRPIATRTRFVLLTHPMEYRKTRIGTGRITHLSLSHSEVHVGIDFEHHPRVHALIDAAETDCRLVYPGALSENLSRGEFRPAPGHLPVFFLVDGTWACAKQILRHSATVRRLPRVGFDPTRLSRFTIKRQPYPECLSTIEAIHRCLTLLDAEGLEDFCSEDGRRLLAPLDRIMELQMRYPGAPVAPASSRHDPIVS